MFATIDLVSITVIVAAFAFVMYKIRSEIKS